MQEDKGQGELGFVLLGYQIQGGDLSFHLKLSSDMAPADMSSKLDALSHLSFFL